MKSGLVALNPHSGEAPSLNNLCLQIHYFQKHGLLKKLDVVSLVHANFFPYPVSVYQDLKNQILNDVKRSLEKGINNCFDYEKLEVIEALESNNDDLVETLSQLAEQRKVNVLILGLDTSDNGYRWLFGGVSQTAALSAFGPTLIMKVNEAPAILPDEPSVLLAIDTTAPPSQQAVEKLQGVLAPMNSKIYLVHVKRKASFLSSLAKKAQSPKEIEDILLQSEKIFKELGMSCSAEILEEGKSFSHTIADYVDAKGIWVTAVTSPSRDFKHRVLWGSTTQSLLSHLKCPVLVLRTN
ncbi:Universal stress protein family protein [compost metagenome]